MGLMQAWLMTTAGIMFFAAILYALEVAPGSFYIEGRDREIAKMFFFAPLWPLWLLVAAYFTVKYVSKLIVGMWKALHR